MKSLSQIQNSNNAGYIQYYANAHEKSIEFISVQP